jgi:hypothetical protein
MQWFRQIRFSIFFENLNRVTHINHFNCPLNYLRLILLKLFCSRAHAQDIRRQTAQELKADHGAGPAAEKAAAIAQRIGRSSVTSISSLTNAGSGQSSFLHPGSSASFASSASVTFGDVAMVRHDVTQFPPPVPLWSTNNEDITLSHMPSTTILSSCVQGPMFSIITYINV